MGSIVPYLVAIIPTIVAAAFFYVIVKRIMEADRNERLAQSKFEAEQDREHAREAAAGHEKAPGNDEKAV
ncbi:hypothetical protein [Arthrobacter sp. NEB 688]|uniref:hypothetical protein n=1 Tax=Arthrobacter sp. NEB 688 TaxID=904039 RepID=UPI001564E445|nr:hypothetical protein [Arthrobacter sp. NEB 688]QKE83244.1 hypothetical protein HL663_04320 [Arthrobacter sp. NEB 688]